VTTTESLAQHEVLSPVSELDRLIFTEHGRGAAVQDDEMLRLELVRESVGHHLVQCPAYARFAEQVGFDFDSLADPKALDYVPQIPTSAFKRSAILSVPAEQTAKRCTSSGTQGTISVVYRDRFTIERLLGSTRRGLELLVGDWYEDEIHVLNLGPDQAEAGDLWFAYVMSLIGVDYPTHHAVRAGTFDPHEALAALSRATAFPVLAGPPALVMEVAEAALVRGGLSIPHLAIVTAGGWKRAGAQRIARGEFNELLLRAFDLENTCRVRDAFNQVELNTVMLECEYHRKHVPPWLHITARSLRTLEPLAYGEQGLLSYLDPSASSYPCFILADDVGTVRRGPCDCGWAGRTLEIERRLDRAESWGCALKMDRAWGGSR
jgi:long-chain-fatty-acid---luciferin-component ligase